MESPLHKKNRPTSIIRGRVRGWFPRLGLRGGFLFRIGIIFILLGIHTWMVTPLESSVTGSFLIHTLVPGEIRAFTWVIPGAIALATAFRVGVHRDKTGFLAVSLALSMYIISYTFSAGVSLFQGYESWYRHSSMIFIYGGFLATTFWMSRQPEFPDVIEAFEEAD